MPRLLLIFTLFLMTNSPAYACNIAAQVTSPVIQQPIFCGSSTGDGNFDLLNGFDLGFDNQDHKPSTLVAGVLTPLMRTLLAGSPLDEFLRDPSDGSTFVTGLSDRDGGDRIEIRAVFNDMNIGGRGESRLLEVSRTDCSGRCIIPVVDVWGSFETPVLRGFAFVRRSEYDDNIRTIAIEPVCTAVGRACHFEVEFADNDSRETYAAVVQYTRLRNDNIIATQTTAGSFDSGDDAKANRLRTLFSDAPGALHAISGFRFRFTEGDRFLGQIRIFASARDQEIEIIYRDGGSEDSAPAVEYRIQSVGLDPEVASR